MMAWLEAAGIGVPTKAEWNAEVGKPVRIYDSEGSLIKLWQLIQ